MSLASLASRRFPRPFQRSVKGALLAGPEAGGLTQADSEAGGGTGEGAGEEDAVYSVLEVGGCACRRGGGGVEGCPLCMLPLVP